MAEQQEMSKVRVLRFDPERNPPNFSQDYCIPFRRDSTILDSLYYIYQHVDPSLAFRGSCFAGGWCNVCTLKVNGRVLLPCNHFMEKEMVIEPLPGYPVLRDLIVDYGGRPQKKEQEK